jgi:hypothetical protein
MAIGMTFLVCGDVNCQGQCCAGFLQPPVPLSSFYILPLPSANTAASVLNEVHALL